MSFTDESLAILKRAIKEKDQSLYYQMSLRDFEALLARLDAAEKLLPPEAFEDCGGSDCEDCAVYRPWRKAAGKSKGETK